MDFRTLEHLSIAQVTEAFNRAFADYSIKLEHTEASMQAHFDANRIQLRLSVGAFEGDCPEIPAAHRCPRCRP